MQYRGEEDLTRDTARTNAENPKCRESGTSIPDSSWNMLLANNGKLVWTRSGTGGEDTDPGLGNPNVLGEKPTYANPCIVRSDPELRESSTTRLKPEHGRLLVGSKALKVTKSNADGGKTEPGHVIPIAKAAGAKRVRLLGDGEDPGCKKSNAAHEEES